MRAIQVERFGEPEVMRLGEVPDPVPGPGQVVIRVAAAGVNPVETYIRAGAYSVLPTLPYTPGSDAAGEVETVGPGVALAKGTRVYVSWAISGTYAEKALCAVEEVHPLPAQLTFAQGAAIGIPYATAWRALFQRAGARPGETVLVHGASGGVGIACLQMGRAAGLAIFGTAGTEAGRALVRSEGARDAFDHGAPGYLEDAVRRTGGKGFDVIIEMLANVNLARDLAALSKGGRVVVVGSRGPIEISPRDLMNRESSILGMRLPNASREDRDSVWAAVEAGVESGVLRPVISRELPLAEAVRAHHEIIEGKAAGKLVLIP